jgi:5-formyltetrahydrofolate cyclo-ligase
MENGCGKRILKKLANFKIPDSHSYAHKTRKYKRSMPELPTPHRKKIHRDDARRKRSELQPQEIIEKSNTICESTLTILNGCRTVMVYASKSPEVDTGTLIAELIGRGTHVVLPIIERETTSLRLSYLKDPTHLVESTFRVPEPIGNEHPAKAEEVDTVVIPMLAFDTEGNRLGYGAGYYDRFLSRHPGIRRIGLAFSCQEADSLPCDENDIRMNLVITEKGIIRCRDVD